jgi:hypothetical protein
MPFIQVPDAAARPAGRKVVRVGGARYVNQLAACVARHCARVIYTDPPRRITQTEEQVCRLLEDNRPVACDAGLSLAHTNVSEERNPSIFRVYEYHNQSSRDLEPRLHF